MSRRNPARLFLLFPPAARNPADLILQEMFLLFLFFDKTNTLCRLDFVGLLSPIA